MDMSVFIVAADKFTVRIVKVYIDGVHVPIQVGRSTDQLRNQAPVYTVVVIQGFLIKELGNGYCKGRRGRKQGGHFGEYVQTGIYIVVNMFPGLPGIRGKLLLKLMAGVENQNRAH